jgi:hypothetical protein
MVAISLRMRTLPQLLRGAVLLLASVAILHCGNDDSADSTGPLGGAAGSGGESGGSAGSGGSACQTVPDHPDTRVVALCPGGGLCSRSLGETLADAKANPPTGQMTTDVRIGCGHAVVSRGTPQTTSGGSIGTYDLSSGALVGLYTWGDVIESECHTSASQAGIATPACEDATTCSVKDVLLDGATPSCPLPPG